MVKQNGRLCVEQFKHILFDLDGTLTDPFEGITNSITHALVNMGIDPPPRGELAHFIGPPLGESFANSFGMNEEEIERAVLLFRDYFGDKGIWENDLLPGVPELLQKLKAAGKGIHLATSKPEVFARKILAHFEIDGYFDFIKGCPKDTHGSEKAEIVRAVLEETGLDPKTAVMVGDRKYDVLGAAENGVGCIGVLVGYGSREELETAGAIAVVRDMQALGHLLLP